MITAQREFERAAAGLGPVVGRRRGGRWSRGARLRLGLAGAGLAALVAWGALSHLDVETPTDGPETSSTQQAPRYDGRGKWTGYTSEWRSRPQILRDAGITQAR